MGVGAVALAYKGLKALFGRGKDKEEKKDDEKSDDKKEGISRWKKALIGV